MVKLSSLMGLMSPPRFNRSSTEGKTNLGIPDEPWISMRESLIAAQGGLAG
jgi:hypothetical protein